MNVLAMPGVPKSWMAHPKYTAFPGIISAYSSASLENPACFDKELSSSPDPYSIFYPSTSDSYLDFHLLHHPSQKIDAQHSRKPATSMMNQHHLLGRCLPPMEGTRYMPPRVEKHQGTAYPQSGSPFTVQHELNSTLSSNGSAYCKSDFKSQEHFDEHFAASTMEALPALVHPTPRSNVLTAADDSFILNTERSPSPPSLGVSDVERNEQALSNAPFNAPNHNFDMGTPFGPHPQQAHLTPSITAPAASLVRYDEHIAWPAGQPVNADIWYPTSDPSGSFADSGWHTHNGYSASWPVNNAYTFPNEYNEPASHAYGMNNGLSMTSFGPPLVSLCSSTSIAHLSYMAAGVPLVPTIEAPPKDRATSQPVSPGTEFGSPDHSAAYSLSPSSSVFTNEEERFSQQSGEDQSGIQTSQQSSEERNTFLIDCKRRGLSYKVIKRVGGFKEAESTLRGRYRTLTKSKEQRVRKPKWEDRDIRLLCAAVNIHTETHIASDSLGLITIDFNEPPKVSWKKVAEHIRKNGGSYHFGNATCKKKWCEIHNIPI